MRTHPRLAVASLVTSAALLSALACRSDNQRNDAVANSEAAAERPAPKLVLDEQGEPVGIEHYLKWSDKIGQGGEPVGEQAYANLAALGYRTVISVDGAAPDLELAARYGLKYVHVPIGYEAVPRDAQLDIVKAVEESDGPVFFHCHHGLHRGPAAAGVARIACDGISSDEAIAGLKTSGTSDKYKGLYRDVAAFRVPTQEELAQAPPLKSQVVPKGMRGSMSFIDRRWDAINASKAAKWGVPANMPDIDPVHEIGMTENAFRDLVQREQKRSEPDARFLELMQVAHAATSELEGAVSSKDGAKADAAYAKLKTACDACHAEYRNNL